MLEDFEESAEEELKRADHMIFVSLKYTRTVDVIRNIILRLINAMDFAALETLNYLKVKNISKVGRMRMEQLIENLPNLKEFEDFYFMLRDIYNSKFTGREEYRKNVTLLTVEGDVNIETLKEYFDKAKRFVKFLEDYCKG